MNVGQILETHLGWAAKHPRLLREDAGVPGRERARDRAAAQARRPHVGARCARAAHAPSSRSPTPTSGRIARRHQAGARSRKRRFDLLDDATLNDLGARGMSQATQDSSTACATSSRRRRASWRERETTRARPPGERSTTAEEHEGCRASQRAEYKAALKQLEKRRRMDAGRTCSRSRSCRRWPACSARSPRRTSMRRRWS